MNNKKENDESRSAILLALPGPKGPPSRHYRVHLQNEGNIIYLDQHVDTQEKVFFMRVEWDLKNFSIPLTRSESILNAHRRKIRHEMESLLLRLYARMAVFVSKLPHCLHDILSRWQSEQWNVRIPVIISNHGDLESVAATHGIDYRITPDVKADKRASEQNQLDILKQYDIDFIVLARYMQILSEDFVSHYPNRIINIHHSFLPAFPGARPYHSAYERGVKIIGATSHYVTADLDSGPIIEQNVVRITHKDSVEDLIRKGRDLEKVVLSQAIWYHLKRKILVYGNRTLIFD
jgi:formyltetrahydrofolate deformylase